MPITLFALGLTMAAGTRGVLGLCPANPHYVQLHNKPTVLISSGEHYGAVLNLDLDQNRYLEALQRDGMNLTRTFSGVYCEDPKSFNIRDNTLAPAAGRYITPWARSDSPGYANGGNRFDLTKWDEGYFRRLKDFVRQAGARGIVVEYVLFCPFYEDTMWRLSPMHSPNNINGVGDFPREEAYTLQHPDLQRVQDGFVRKAVNELNGFSNVYFEICNEPYFGGVKVEWQRHIADVIVETERGLPNRHLIAQNIANGSAKIVNPHPAISIFNFHYASPPDAVAANYGLNRAVSFDETGFKGSDDATYRREAWEFILAGGAIFDNLDYSFTAAHPDGTQKVEPPTPGGGSTALRKQLHVLRRFLEGFDFVRMAPDHAAVHAAPEGITATVLSEPGRAYAVYLHGSAQGEIELVLPDGSYTVEWIDTMTGLGIGAPAELRGGNGARLRIPGHDMDIALRIRRR